MVVSAGQAGTQPQAPTVSSSPRSTQLHPLNARNRHTSLRLYSSKAGSPSRNNIIVRDAPGPTLQDEHVGNVALHAESTRRPTSSCRNAAAAAAAAAVQAPPPPPGGVHLTCNCPSCHACRDVLPQRPVAGGVVQTHTTVLRGVQHAPNGMVGRNPATSAN
jgi:hypothetical protein